MNSVEALEGKGCFRCFMNSQPSRVPSLNSPTVSFLRVQPPSPLTAQDGVSSAACAALL